MDMVNTLLMVLPNYNVVEGLGRFIDDKLNLIITLTQLQRKLT